VRDPVGEASEVAGERWLGREFPRCDGAHQCERNVGGRLPEPSRVVRAARVNGLLLVADVGGGSTELVLGSSHGTDSLRSFSMDVGCVRMTERHLRDDPPTAEQVSATVADLQAALATARAHVPFDSAATLVGVAGTVTTIAAIALDLEAYDPDRIHGSTITIEQVEQITARLLRMTHDQRAALPVMHPGRVDVIGGGALVLRTLMRECQAPAVIASEHDILDGIVLSVVDVSG